MPEVDKGRALAVLKVCVDLTKEEKFSPALPQHLSYDAIRKAVQKKHGRNNIGDVRHLIHDLLKNHFLLTTTVPIGKEKINFYAVPDAVMGVYNSI